MLLGNGRCHPPFLLQQRLFGLEPLAQPAQFGLDRLQGALPRLFFAQLLLDVHQLGITQAERAFGLAALLGYPLPVLVPLADAQQVGQDLLALAGGFGGEFVGLPLEQKAGVDEGIVVHAQQRFDGRLGLAHAAFGEGFPAIVAGLQL